MKRIQVLAAAVGAVLLVAGPAFPTAQQIGVGDTALLFGGIDAEGGIGDWYLSNGVIEAIIDDVGIQDDLTAIVGGGSEPPIQSEINPTGGTIIDLALSGTDGDQLPQLFTVAGLSTENFLLYDTISAPSADTIRVSGGVLFPPDSVAPTPCLTVVTDYTAAGTDNFITITSTATNGCGVALTGFGGFLDVFVWTIRGIIPFSGGGAPSTGGKGFNHPILDLANPVLALEQPGFMGGPGLLDTGDGITDTTDSSSTDPVSYGLIGDLIEVDPDGPGGSPPTTSTVVNLLFGVSGNLISALGNFPVAGPPVGGTLTYTRRVYVGGTNDVRAVSNDILTEYGVRRGYLTGTLSGDVDASDTTSVEASILVNRIGECTTGGAPCKVNADCTGGTGPCVDPGPAAPGQFVGQAITQIRTDADGLFSGVVLAEGEYELVVSASGRDDVVVSPVVVASPGDTPAAIPAMSGRGTVAFSVTEKGKGNPPIPAKLVFKGVGATSDPRFNKDIDALADATDILPETFGGTQAGSAGSAAGQGNVVYTATGSGSIEVAPGTYDVYASRGMEYAVDLETITVTAGATTDVSFRIKRVLKTKDAISADFHVHSGRGLDTGAALRDRVTAFAAENVEVMVATDHDRHVDYAPLITSLGLGSQVTSIIGNEVTGSVPAPPAFPQSFGHINAWPLTVAADEARDGAIDDEYVAPNYVYSRLRDQGAEVIMYNHPRAGVSGVTTIGLFNNIGCDRCANDIDMTCTEDADCPAGPEQDCTCVGYQPDRTIGMVPNDVLLDDGVLGPGTAANPDGFDNLDFDAMEIANGGKAGDFPGYRQVRYDWLSLLQQGIYRPVTGVSDSHRITVEHAGWARSYVFGVGDDPATVNTTALNDAVKAGNVLSAAGVFIEFSVRCAGGVKGGLGETLTCPSGKIRLKIKVQSPAWVPIEEVRVIANGDLLQAFDETTKPRVKGTPANFESSGRRVRFRKTLKVEPTVDTYYIVEAGPKLDPDINVEPTPPPIVDIIVPGIVPNAITNPIFIDRDGNMTFDAPGTLPPPIMAQATGEPEIMVADAGSGLWSWLVRTASSLLGGDEAVADSPKTGRMTGVTKEDKAKAVREGEYFPLHEFRIPDAAVEQLRRDLEAEAAAEKKSE